MRQFKNNCLAFKLDQHVGVGLGSVSPEIVQFVLEEVTTAIKGKHKLR